MNIYSIHIYSNSASDEKGSKHARVVDEVVDQRHISSHHALLFHPMLTEEAVSAHKLDEIEEAEAWHRCLAHLNQIISHILKALACVLCGYLCWPWMLL